jgi:hypothetical protein
MACELASISNGGVVEASLKEKSSVSCRRGTWYGQHFIDLKRSNLAQTGPDKNLPSVASC